MSSSTEKKRSAPSGGLNATELEVGRKARRLLEEEKDKRREKEIIRLDDSLENSRRIPFTSRSFTGIATPSPLVNENRGGDLIDTNNNSSNSRRKNEERSDTIRIQGVPRGCQLHHIHKFFSGLDPQRVFLIPPLDHTIPILDVSKAASDSSVVRGGKKDKAAVGGHSSELLVYPAHIRIFVKFNSLMIADLALQRSGEIMHYTSDSKEERSIELSPIPKAISLFLHRFMAMDITKDLPIEQLVHRLQDTTTTTMKLVYNILWLAFQQQTGVNVPIKTLELPSSSSSSSCKKPIETKLIFHLHPPRTREEYSNLSSLYNALWDIHFYIEQSQSPFSLFLGEKDGGGRVMTVQAGLWLVEQMKSIQGCIYHSIRKNLIKC